MGCFYNFVISAKLLFLVIGSKIVLTKINMYTKLLVVCLTNNSMISCWQDAILHVITEISLTSLQF